MNRRTTLVLLLVAVLAVAALQGCGAPDSADQSAGTPTPPADPEGQALVEAKCTLCHTIERVEEADKSEAEWRTTVARMVDNGLVATDEEKAQIIDYLATRDAAR